MFSYPVGRLTIGESGTLMTKISIAQDENILVGESGTSVSKTDASGIAIETLRMTTPFG